MSIIITPKSRVIEFVQLWAQAETAGKLAAANVKVKDYLITSVDFLNKPIANAPQYVMNGTCGFAWLIIKPANSRFGKWLLAGGLGRKSSYEGGVRVSIYQYGQCMEQKEAHAHAMSAVIAAAGLRCYADSRMD